MNAKRGMVSVALAAAMAVTVCAADRTWDGGGAADSNFSTTNNWDLDTLPAFDGTDRAVFGTGGATATVDTGVSLSGITFNRDAAFTVANGAGSLTLGAGGLSALLPSTTSRTYQIQEDVSFAANQVWSLTNNGAGVATVEVSGTLGDGDSAFSLTKRGNGTLVLSGSNTYDGITTVQAGGPLRVTHGNALGSTNGATFVQDYGWLELSGGVTVPEPISLAGADPNTSWQGALRSMSGSNVLTGVLSGGPRISCKTGSLHILGGIQTGGTVIDAVAGSYIRIAEKPINFGAGSVSLYGTALFVIDVTNNVWGTLFLQGTVVRTDRENVLATGGALSMGDLVNVLNLNGKNQTVWRLSFTSATGSSSINSDTPATLTVNQSTTTEFKGAFTGAAGLVKTGTGALTLSGASTLSGAVIVSNGTLLVTGTLGAACTNVAVAGGTLTISNSTALSDAAALRIADGATMTLAGGGSETVNTLFLNGDQQKSGTWGAEGSGATHTDGHFAGSGTLTVKTSSPVVPVATTWDGEDSGTLFGSATNWAGDTVPAFDGTTHAIFGTGGATATVDTAANLYGMVFNRDADFTVANGAGGVTLGAGGIIAALPSATSRTYRVEEDLVFVENQVWGITNNGAGAATLAVSGSLGDGLDTYSLTLSGNGTLALSGNNTYDGATTVKTSAVLRVTHDNALGSTNGATVVEDGGRLILSGGITVRDNLSLNGDKSTSFQGVLWSTGGTNVLRGRLVVGARVKCLDGQLDLLGGSTPGTSLIAAADTGARVRIAENPVNFGGNTFYAHSTALLILDVTNNVWGTMEAAGLTSVRTDRPNVLPPASTLRLASGVTVAFDLNGQDQTIGKLECAVVGNYFLGSTSPATLTVNQNSPSEFKGSVTGAVTVVKSGTGALTLSGTNTLSGAVVVSNGTLLVTGAGTLGVACTNVAVAGGTLTLSNSVAIADTAALNIANGGSAKVNLAGGVNETVGFLYFAGRQQRAGTYSAVSGGGVQVVDAIHFAGTGILRVLHDNAGTVISLR